MDYRILIVEDEAKIARLLADYCYSKKDVPTLAGDGIRALEMLEEQEYDAVLLDILMPGLDGLSVCRAIRKRSDVPILFLTALSDEEDKLLGYELGADDYITKPFSLSVLYAKVEALVRRRRGAVIQGDLLIAGAVSLRLSTRKVTVSGREIPLTPKEYALLLCLEQTKTLVLSREQLLVKCWGYDYEGEARAVDTQIGRLRQKLGAAGEHIRTVIKAGYKWEE